MQKSIFKNSVYNMIYKGFTALFPLITTTYISRVLLADGVGRVSYANTIVTYFVLIASLGIPFYGIKCIAQSNNGKKSLNTAFWELFYINAISTTICIIIYYLIVNCVPYFSSKAQLFNIFGSLLFFNYLNLDWFYQGIEEFSYIATRSIIIKILSFILMLLFVKDTSDYLIYSMILCLATAGNYVLNGFNLKKYIRKDCFKLNLIQHLKPIFILSASSIAQELYSTLDTIMLEYFYGDSCVGYYSNSVKITKMVYTLSIAMVASFFPRVSQYIKNKEKKLCDNLLTIGTELIFIIAIPGTIGIALTSNYSIPLFFGDTFLPAIFTLKILSILIFVLSIAYFLGHVILMAAGKENNILKATLIGAISNFVLNLILIPKFMQNGAAIASICSEIIVMFLLIKNSKKYFSLNITKQFVFSVILGTIFMGIYVWSVTLFCSNSIIGMICSIFGGVIIYTITLIIMKNDMSMYFINMIKNKMKG